MPSASASALSRQMPVHRSGLPAAIRVVSLKPPAASRMSSPPSPGVRRREVDQRGRGDVRDVADDGDRLVVRLGVDRDDARAERRDERVIAAIGIRIGVWAGVSSQ